MSSATVSALAPVNELILMGEFARARELTHQLLASAAWPTNRGAVLQSLGMIALGCGEPAEAEQRFLESVTEDDTEATWWHNLAMAQAAAGDWTKAGSTYKAALGKLSGEALLWAGWAKCSLNQGDYAQALTAYWRAANLGHDELATLKGIATSLVALRRYREAEELLHPAILAHPGDGALHSLLADAAGRLGLAVKVREHRETALRLNPGDYGAMAKLAAACWDSGELARSLELCREVIDAGRATSSFHSFYLSGLLHQAAMDGPAVCAAHRRWAGMHAPSIGAETVWPNAAISGHRLRIGYIGTDFYFNPSYHFLIPFFRNHDHLNFEVFGYDLRETDDECTEQFRNGCDHWRRCRAMTDAELRASVAADGIDIAIDTTGHYAGGRPWMYRDRLAPVQVTFPNYPCTVGLESFDGIVSDEWVCPEGSEGQYAETPLKLPSGYLPYAAPEAAPPCGTLPALDRGFITFGLFQRPVKISPANWDAIARILLHVKGSRLLIHNAFAELNDPDSYMRRLYAGELLKRNVSVERLEFRGPVEMNEHLEILASADIALDTFPYNGQTTTCECLWMGVPVVTLRGSFHVARVGLAILSRVGLERWVADTAEEYVNIATEIANRLDLLAQARANLRCQVEKSNLLDGTVTTREFEASLRGLWKKWCLGRTRNNG